MTDAITCPRRLHESGPWDHERFLDRWTEDGTCSFCGSMQPAALFRHIERRESITPTDKSYKVYIGNRKFYFQHFSDDEQGRFIALHNAGQLRLDYPGYFYVRPYFCAPQRINGHAG
jgi:hypothetical protein